MSSDANLNIRAQFTADTAQGDKLKKLVEDLKKKQIEQAAQFEKTRYSADRISKVFTTVSTQTHTLTDKVTANNAVLHKGSLDFKRYDESSQNVAQSSHRMGGVIGEQVNAFGALGGAMKQAEAAQTNVAKSSDGLRGKLGTLGSVFSDQALGLTATTMAGVALVKNWTDLSDTANDLVGKEITLAKTKEDLQDAQEKVNRMQEEGKTGTFEYQQALDDLNITQQELTEATEDVRVTQEKLKNEQTEFALSVLPTVISAAANLKGMYDGLKEAGISFSGTLPKITGGLKNLGTTLKGLGLTNPFFIALTAGAALMTAFSTNAFGLRDAINGVGKALGDAVPFLKPLLDGLGWLGEQIGGVFGTAEATTTAATQNMTREVVKFGFETQSTLGGVSDIVGALSAAFEGSKSNVTQFMGDVHLLQQAITELQLASKDVEGEGVKKFAQDMNDILVPMLDSLITLYPDHNEKFEEMKTTLASNLTAPDASKIQSVFATLITLMADARVKVIEYNEAQRGTFQTAVDNAKLIDEQVLALASDVEAKKKDIVTTYELGKASETLTGTTDELSNILKTVVNSEILATKQNLLLEEAIGKSNMTTQEQLNTLALWAPAMRDLSTEFDSTHELISEGRDVLTGYFQSQASVEDKMKIFNALLKGESIPAVKGLTEADLAFIKMMQEMIKTGTGNNDMLATFGKIILGTADDTETATEALYTYDATQKKIKDTEAQRIAGLQELAQEMTGLNLEQVTSSKTLSDLIIMGAKQKSITNDVAIAVQELSVKHALDARQKEIDTKATWAFAAATHGVIAPVDASIERIQKMIQTSEALSNAHITGKENIDNYIDDLKVKQAIEEAETKTLTELTRGQDTLLDAFGRTNAGMKQTIEVMLGTEKGMEALADMARKTAEDFQKSWEEGLDKTKAIFSARADEFAGVASKFTDVVRKAIKEGELSEEEMDIFKNVPKEMKTNIQLEMQGEEAIEEFFSDFVKGDAQEAIDELEEAVIESGSSMGQSFSARKRELEGMNMSIDSIARILYSEFGTDPFKTVTVGMEGFSVATGKAVAEMDNWLAKDLKIPANITDPIARATNVVSQLRTEFADVIPHVGELKTAFEQFDAKDITADELLQKIVAYAHQADAQIPGMTSEVLNLAGGMEDLKLSVHNLPEELIPYAETDASGIVTGITAIGTAVEGMGESIRNVSAEEFAMLQENFQNVVDLSPDLNTFTVDVGTLGSATNKLKEDKVGPEELSKAFADASMEFAKRYNTIISALQSMPGAITQYMGQAGTNTAVLATHFNTTRGKIFTSIGGINQAMADVPKAVDNMAKAVMTPIAKFYNNLQAGFNKTVGLANTTAQSLKNVQSAANQLKSKSVTYTTTHVTVYKTQYAQHGMDEIVTAPRTIHVGEHGKPERVTVTPLTNPNDSSDKTLQPMALNKANVKIKGINDLPSRKPGNQSSQSVSINSGTSSRGGADIMTMFTQMRQDMREQMEMIVNRMGRSEVLYSKIDLILEHYQLAPLAEVTQQVALRKNSSSM